MENIISKIREYLNVKKIGKINNIVILLMSIFSVLFGFFWYIAITLAVISIISSTAKIKETGDVISKVSMAFAIVGIVNCAMIYISIFLMVYSELVVFV